MYTIRYALVLIWASHCSRKLHVIVVHFNPNLTIWRAESLVFRHRALPMIVRVQCTVRTVCCVSFNWIQE